MKRSLVLMSVCGLFLLGACSQKEETNDTKSTVESTMIVEESSSAPEVKNLAVGETYKFTEKDLEQSGYDNVGLELTVDKISVDKNLQLNTDYSDEDYTGLIPIIIDATFKNTTDKSIDLTSFDLITKDGEQGKWVPYLEGVSTEGVDVLNPGQSIKLKEVFGSPTENNFYLNYANAAWEVN
ncbi:putative lipoprotein [Streptococcus acidominimus]|uniref:Putative lipoprotein n=1 Tax=Streptococcus acidominimus TaxID=1326 RepID=A0A239WZM2_STRAI|nr:hypothetical protein [Streptococcus acidominimus]SNV39882.1 putative lipoprotein [Streptococcus acidominimus]